MPTQMPLDDFALHYPNMRIGRFTLKAGETIPLHIHANQFGLAYLLEGKCQVTTYDVAPMEDELFLLTLRNQEDLTAHSYTMLTPKTDAHEIYAIEDSILLDIFAPGKAEGMVSEYLDVIKTNKDDTQLTAKIAIIESVKLPESLSNNTISFINIT